MMVTKSTPFLLNIIPRVRFVKVLVYRTIEESLVTSIIIANDQIDCANKAPRIPRTSHLAHRLRRIVLRAWLGTFTYRKIMYGNLNL
mmetsp:Transcript_42332/g.88838  ORF Transcript_42332/g.88838 Transcript_42332/m.88838 type:complete len:87 (-) Transcript_42332:29-289(-)